MYVISHLSSSLTLLTFLGRSKHGFGGKPVPMIEKETGQHASEQARERLYQVRSPTDIEKAAPQQ